MEINGWVVIAIAAVIFVVYLFLLARTEGNMLPTKEMKKAAMLGAGAVLLQCPHCDQETPVYCKNKERSAFSTMCLHCGEGIQVAGYNIPVKVKIPFLRDCVGKTKRTRVRYGMGLGADADDMKEVRIDLRDRQFENDVSAREFMHDLVDELFNAWADTP